MPYKTPIGDRTYDTGDFDGHMTPGDGSWPTGPASRTASRPPRKAGKIRGIGMATYIECTAWGEGEDVDVRLEKDGTVTVLSGTQSNGQGHATAYAQFAAQHLDLPLDKISVVQGDTDRVATGQRHRRLALDPDRRRFRLRRVARISPSKLKELAADELEAGIADLEIVDGAVRIAGTDRRDRLRRSRRAAARRRRICSPATATSRPPNATYPNGTHIAEVEIDPGDRRHHGRALHDRRRFRHRREPDPARGPGPWRRRAGNRPGAAASAPSTTRTASS